MDRSKKSLCITCEQEKGIAICVGCSKIFCYEHLAEHRHELNQILEEIVENDGRVMELLDQQLTSGSEEHPLVQRINDWENVSIEKIRRTAADARRGLLQKVPQNLLEIQKTLQTLTVQVQQVRRNNGFLEADLNEWQEKLQRIRKQLEILDRFQVEDPSSTLVHNLRADVFSLPDVFERIVEIATLDDNINSVIRPRTESHLEVFGKYELFSGQRTYRFKIEDLDHTRWVFFGVNAIISELLEPSNLSARLAVYQAGAGINLPTVELIRGDTIALLIDCDQRLLQLTNERTQNTLEMPVDTSKCPLPWQLHLNLHQGSTRLRVI